MGKLLTAVRSNDKRRMLAELRDQIAKTIEGCESGRDMAALSKRIMEIVEDIEDIDAAKAEAMNPVQAAQNAFGNDG